MSWFDDETKTLFGVLGLAAMLLVGAVRGCDNDLKEKGIKAAVQVECLKAGKPALECKELR